MSRRSRDELRQLMIDAGCQLLTTRGLAFDPPSLTYANVFQHLAETRDVRVHRSQVHGRIWESQEHYRTDVVIETIRSIHPGSEEVDDLVADLARDKGISNLRELVEGWVAATVGLSHYGADADLGLDLFIAAQALSPEDGATSAPISAEASRHVTERMLYNERRYDSVATSLGVDFISELGISRGDLLGTLARNAASLVEGARMTESLDGDAAALFDVVDEHGNTQQADAATLGLITLVEQLFGLAP